jgi:hypothetical protein
MKRQPGRPPLDDDDETVPASTKLPSRVYDDLDRRATAARVSLSEQIRRDIAAASKKSIRK